MLLFDESQIDKSLFKKWTVISIIAAIIAALAAIFSAYIAYIK